LRSGSCWIYRGFELNAECPDLKTLDKVGLEWEGAGHGLRAGFIRLPLRRFVLVSPKFDVLPFSIPPHGVIMTTRSALD
jgi:hypothetical protein